MPDSWCTVGGVGRSRCTRGVQGSRVYPGPGSPPYHTLGAPPPPARPRTDWCTATALPRGMWWCPGLRSLPGPGQVSLAGNPDQNCPEEREVLDRVGSGVKDGRGIQSDSARVNTAIYRPELDLGGGSPNTDIPGCSRARRRNITNLSTFVTLRTTPEQSH